MNHGRKYRGGNSYVFPLWNGIFEHYSRIGVALWEFAWCIDAITKEHDGVGLVHGGAPVKTKTIAAALKGSKRETVRRHMEVLEAEKFIRRRRTPYGYVIEVLNSRKFEIWKRREEKQQREVSPFKEKPIGGSQIPTGGSEKPQKVVYKEDTAEDTAEDAAAKRPASASELWRELGMAPRSIPPELREICEGLYGTRGSQPIGDLIGTAMDLWEDQGEKIPARLAKAAADIRKREKQQSQAACAPPVLEDLPWVKR